MTTKTSGLSTELYDYVRNYGVARPDVIQRELIAETARALPDQAVMQISPEQGAFMTLLTKIVGVRFAVEVGTFTGYSALSVARGLADGGQLLALDVSEEFTKIAQRYWERAGVADRIELKLGPAADSLRALQDEPTIDLAFIDADKGGYIAYWEELVPRMRRGGVILVDNVFAGGEVHDTASSSEMAQSIRAFNDHAERDERVELTMVPIADGLTMARRL